MPVYVFREGNSNIFKIGLTRCIDVSPRRTQLNSGSSAGLREFEVIQTEEPRELEAFLHRLLRHRNVERHGGREFFEMISENHMREVLSRVELMFRRRQFATTSADQFEKASMRGEPSASEPVRPRSCRRTAGSRNASSGNRGRGGLPEIRKGND